MNRVSLINYFIEKFNLSSYLEIGVAKGGTFGSVSCAQKESVDPADNFYSDAKPTHKMTSDEFFESIKGSGKKWDIIFIDGLHESQQVNRDIENSIRHLSEKGFIILHDCNPLRYEYQVVPDPRPRRGTPWNGDVWRSVVKFRNENKDYGCSVIDYDEGLGIISSRLPVTNIEAPETLDYKSLELNRHTLLGLVDKKLVSDFLESI